MASNNSNTLIEEHFINIPIPGLGDCFYETLRLYGKLYNVPQLNQTVLQLRKYVHSEIMKKSDTNEQFQIVLSGIQPENLGIIKKKEQFLNDANIAAVQLAYRIFNINIIFYNVDANGIRIDRYPERINPHLDTIHIIRKDDIHFELLIPIGDPIQVYGFAEMIRDARLEADDLEEERDTLITRIYAKELKRTLASVNKEFKDKIEGVRAEQEEAEEQASELMSHPENQQAAHEASLHAASVFNKNHIANLSNAIQQFHVESSYGPAMAAVSNQALFAAKNEQEAANAAFAHQLASQLEEESKPKKKKGPKLPPKKGGTRKRHVRHMRRTKKLKRSK